MMAKQSADVSIVTANYNNGRYLDDFFESILKSSRLPLELIFVDDGSTDESLKIIEKYLHLPFLKIIRFEKNRGFCHALNTGVKASTAKYILRADPDDVFMEERIALQTKYLESHKEIAVVGSNAIYFRTETGKKLMVSNFPVNHQQILHEYLMGDHGVLHASTLIRSAVFKQYAYHQENYLVEDYDIFARMIADGHLFANIAKPLLKVRIHNSSAAGSVRFETIQKTFNLRDKIFGTTTPLWKIKFYYCYMLNYRRFLLSKSKSAGLVYLGFSVLCQPGKLLKRIF